MAPSGNLENIRRMAERGMSYAHYKQDSKLVDIFQHILDNYELVKREINNDRTVWPYTPSV